MDLFAGATKLLALPVAFPPAPDRTVRLANVRAAYGVSGAQSTIRPSSLPWAVELLYG